MSGLLRSLLGLAITASAAQAQLADSAMSRLRQLARESNPVLATRRARVEVAVARRGATALLPPLSVSAEIEEVPSFLNVFSASQRIDLSREIVPATRRTAEREVADRDVDRARLELDVTERALDAAVEQLVAKAAGSAAIAMRLSAEDSLLRGAEEALRTRFAVGDARYVDVLRLRTERLRIETDINRVRVEERLSRRQLMRLAALADSAQVAQALNQAVTTARERYLRGTLLPLPSIDSLVGAHSLKRLATLLVERADAARRLVIAEQRPTINASLGLQRFATDHGSTVGITAGVSLPLAFSARKANGAHLAVADRELTLARAEQRAAEARLVAASGTAIERYEAARAQIAAFDAALLRGARDEREAALAAYRNGSMTLIELLDFERALAQAEVSRIRSQTEAADALLELIGAALGADELLGTTLSRGGVR